MINFTHRCIMLASIGLLFISCVRMDWGHHFTFTIELGYDIDSIQVVIGDKENWIYSIENYPDIFEGNLEVPEKGYPHDVQIIVYENNRGHRITADPFNCYNCDGSHEYILRVSRAKYVFHN